MVEVGLKLYIDSKAHTLSTSGSSCIAPHGKIIYLIVHNLVMQQTYCFESEVLGFGVRKAALYLFDLQESFQFSSVIWEPRARASLNVSPNFL